MRSGAAYGAPLAAHVPRGRGVVSVRGAVESGNVALTIVGRRNQKEWVTDFGLTDFVFISGCWFEGPSVFLLDADGNDALNLPSYVLSRVYNPFCVPLHLP